MFQSTDVTERMIKKWRKPPCEFLKANRDAALDPRTKTMEIGIIIRDEGGEVLVTIYAQKKHVTKPTLGERAMHYGRR